MRTFGLVVLGVATGCYSGVDAGFSGSSDPSAGASGASSAGDDGGVDPDEDDGADEDPVPEGEASASGLRRLTRGEYDNTLEDLLHDDTRPATTGGLPEELSAPFLNDYRAQIASAPLIEGAERLAQDVAERLIADPPRLASVMPCTPSGPTDDACFREFITEFGRRAFRRSLTQEEIDGFASLQSYATTDEPLLEADFNTALQLAIAAVLQDVSFLYRLEVGKAVEGRPGVFHLTGYEVATRMSYLVWGSMPDDTLLDLAEAGDLGTAEERADAVVRMLDDDRALRQLDEFHSQWIGYRTMLVEPELRDAMRAETSALLERAAFEDGHNYLELFTSNETFIESDVLAQHYGLEGAGWVSLAGTGRGGILGQGSFLTAHNNFDDTSPVKRGVFIREWILCDPIPPPPPDVADEVPEATSDSPCKVQRLKDIHHADPVCATCHTRVDPIGFGLEAFDKAGQFRTAEADNPMTADVDESICQISGDGELPGEGTFNGPGELGRLIADSASLDACLVKQLFRFTAGRSTMEDGTDDLLLDELAEQFSASDHDIRALITELVSRDEFVLRREDGEV